MNETRAADIVLRADRLSKQFPRKKTSPLQALQEISLQVQAGEITGLVGPDGAGKTTLLRLAAGLLQPSAGSISVLGLDCAAQPIEIQSRIGYMPQQFGLYQDLTVRENLDLYADLQGLARDARAERFEQLLDMTDLGSFTGRRAGHLSGGMKQKLGLACSLLKSPEMLLLDEPTVGVDPVSRRDLWRIVYQLVEKDQIGVLMSTAYLDEADRCHRVVALQEGKILAEGTPEKFRDRVRGRVFSVAPAAGSSPRDLQARLAGETQILDATIRSGRVRCVLEEGAGSSFQKILAVVDHGETASCEPNFEDAFMTLMARDSRQVEEAATVKSSGGDAAGTDDVVIEARDLQKLFGDFEAVKGISFQVQRGKIFGLLGPNGAGKTTTFRMLCGLTSVSGGEVRVAGRDLRRTRAKARERLGYMAQMFSLYRQLSVRDNLSFYGKAYGLSGRRLRERIDWALDEFELRARQHAAAGALPGGFRQRLAMAAAMLHEPAILFLDEPTSGADPLARREFWLRINGFAQQGVAVIVTTHFMEEAEYCDRMLIMSRGSDLAQGTPEEIRRLARTEDNQEPTIEDAFIALAEGGAAPAGQMTEDGGRHS